MDLYVWSLPVMFALGLRVDGRLFGVFESLRTHLRSRAQALYSLSQRGIVAVFCRYLWVVDDSAPMVLDRGIFSRRVDPAVRRN